MNTLSALAASFLLLTFAASIGASCGGGVQVGATGSQGGAAGAASTGSGSQGGAAGAASSAGSGDQGGTAGAASSAGSGEAGAGGTGGCAGIRHCQGHVYECGDGIDSDGDGLVDEDDPECYGPCDNSEDNLHLSIPSQGVPCYMDCYFDIDNGTGNDDCYWDHRCDPLEVPPFYYPESNNGSSCAYDPNVFIPGTLKTCAELHDMQSPACHTACDPITPNGCDCFGCCELPAHSNHFVWLGGEDSNGNPTCTLDAALDPEKCPPCEPVLGCINPCEACELCLGKLAVPLGCDPLSQCAPGLAPCGLPGQACCPDGFYCVTGCCQPEPT